jgi:hypothetical protein
MKRVAALCVLVLAFAAWGDEGMWTFDNFPSKKVKQKYGFAPDAQWLQEAQLASVRLAGGCSGSFVSPEGLVMTNHHCSHSCIEQLSTKEKDFVAQGFYAPALENEVKCPEIELNELIQIGDVTARVQGSTQGLKPGKEFNDKRKAAMAAIEKECAAGNDRLRCDVVELYHGGQYSLYQYKRFQDVRLVFAPEMAIAFFGGDPDNFNFPRYDLDVSFLRAWEDGKPARTEHYFRWSSAGAKEGDLTFVSGHPGGTDRELTMAQLQYERDVALPERLFDLAQYRGALTMFTQQSAEHHRIAENALFSTENSYKAIKGRFEALVTPALWNQKAGRERLLRAKVEGKSSLRRKYAGAWDEVAKAVAMFQPRRKEYKYVELAAGFNTPLYRIARDLVRGTEELQKPNEQRLREYTDARLPQLKQKLFSKAPIYEDFEVFKLSYGLVKVREAVLSSNDPMIQFAKLVDGDARPIRKWHDEEVETLETVGAERVAAAKFELEGKSNYPDATFTLRLSYGAVKGYEENGRRVQPFTNVAGAFERATGRDPFRLPESWIRANESKQLNLSTPFNLCTTNDIIGGNSGSPVFDKDRQIVGLIFDGNIQSLGGEYGFDETVNRAISVDSAALIEALDHVYGARRIVGELKSAPGAASGAAAK